MTSSSGPDPVMGDILLTADEISARLRELAPFEIPPKFIVGYGMDYAQRYRNLPYIATLEPAGQSVSPIYVT